MVWFLASLVACQVQVTDPSSPEAPTVEAEPRFVWSRAFTGPSEEDEIDAVAASPDGSVTISGKFEDILTLEGHDAMLSSAGRADIPVVRYAADGTIQWVRHFGGGGEDNIFDATTDSDGNLYLSGYFSGVVDFGDWTLTTSGIDDLDLVVVSLDPFGDVRWVVQAGGPGTDGGNEIGIAPDGSVLVLAESDGPFAAGVLDFLPSQNRDAFVLRLDSDSGEFTWGAQVAGEGEVRPKSLAIAPDGRFFAGGDYGLGNNRVVVGDQAVDLPSAQLGDAFVVAFDTDGSVEWTRGWGGEGRDLCKGAVATEDGLFLVGEMEGSVTFDPGLTLETNGPDLFVWHLDFNGDSHWVNILSGPSSLRGSEVVAHPDGGVVFGHRIFERTLLEGVSGDLFVEPEGSESAPILLSYTRQGDLRFAIQPASAPNANIDEIAIIDRRVYLDMVIFEGSYSVGTDTRDSGPSQDALVVAVDL